MNADLLLHDGQFTADEYRHKMGWGHCSMEDATLFASLAGVKLLLLFHHDPAHTDAQLRTMFSNLRHNSKYAFKYELAVEGMQFELQ